MKISRFAATGVYGYMDFEVTFIANPTILTGPNGSGKTTALKLMQALLTPSLPDLVWTEFVEATIEFDTRGRVCVINARKSRSLLRISVTGVRDALEIPIDILPYKKTVRMESSARIEAIRYLKMAFSGHPILRAIEEIESPLFLGLDRRNRGLSFQEDDQEGASRPSGRALPDEMLSAGLSEVQNIIRHAFRRTRQVRDQHSEHLRRKLLLSGFSYQDPDERFTLPDFRSSKTGMFAPDIIQQREELVSALLKIGITADDITKEVDPFFERMMQLERKLSVSEKSSNAQQNIDLMVEIFLNQANLHRLALIGSAVRNFNKKSEGVLDKFKRFEQCVNRFFLDSGKKLLVDEIGAIRIYRPNDTEVPMNALSSGERQLLIMFGHIFFNSFANLSNTFVIDEPELSLHLRWQEMLLEEMVTSNPRAQIVVATHSPEIVGDLYENCIEIYTNASAK